MEGCLTHRAVFRGLLQLQLLMEVRLAIGCTLWVILDDRWVALCWDLGLGCGVRV